MSQAIRRAFVPDASPVEHGVSPASDVRVADARAT